LEQDIDHLDPVTSPG